jgi:hypothetical protein
MGVYTLFSGVTAAQSAPGTTQVDANGVPYQPISNVPIGSIGVRVDGGGGETVQASNNQSFHVVVVGTSGNVSATVQPIVSNDGVNWIAYGSPITIASGATPQQGSAINTGFWKYFSAYVTAITGAGATAKCMMAA